MPTYSFHLHYTLSGDVSQAIKLFNLQAGDQVSVKAVTINSIDFDKVPLGFGEGMSVAAFTQWHTSPVLPDYLTSGFSFGAFNGLNHLIVQAPRFWTYLENYEATRTYSANGTFAHTDNVPSNYNNGSWGGSDALYLSLYSPWGAAFNLTPDFVSVSISLTTNRPKPDVPTQFTQEQKDKFLADAATIDKLTDGMTTMGSAVDPTSVPLNGLNWLIDQAGQALNPQIGVASATAKTMPEVLLTAGILSENLPAVGPIAFTVGLASIFTTRASDLLKALANDPPDLNYGEVLDFPQEAFADIDGIGETGNALLKALYEMVGDLTEILAAAERFQGADFAEATAAKTAQEAAFDAGLSAYNARRVAVADALAAFLAESVLPDVNFEDSTSTSLAATFFQGLGSLTEDPILNDFVTGLIDSFFPSSQPAQLLQAIQDALADPDLADQMSAFAPFALLGDFVSDIEDAIGNTPASPFTGSVLGGLDDVIASLSTEPPPPPPVGPEVTMTGNGVDISDGDSTPDPADHTAFGTHAVKSVVTRTFTVTNDGSEALTLSSLKLPTGFKPGTDKLVTKLQPGQSDTFSVVLDTKKVGLFGGAITFKTNDPDEADFNFAISGAVAAPEIDVTGNNLPILDNDKLLGVADGSDFGSAPFGAPPIVRTFTIHNPGGLALSISNVTVPVGFTLAGGTLMGGGFPASVAAGGSATIEVQLNTNVTGIRKGDIVITSNDANEATFNFTIQGGVTPQLVPGDANANLFTAQAHAEIFSGFDGSDTVSYLNSNVAVVASLLPANAKKNSGYASGDTYDAIENLRGSNFADTLTGNASNNVLEGGKLGDKLDGGSTSKTDIDTASYANATGGVTADLLKSKNNLGEALGDTYKNIENLLGSAFGDALIGNKTANVLIGGEGDDVLTGGGGGDILVGGPGFDAFAFTSPNEGPAYITDFTQGEDVIQISRKGFGMPAGVGHFNDLFNLLDFDTHYWVSHTFNPLTDFGHGQFLFLDATYQQLLWDPDGALDNKPAVLVASFANPVDLKPADFLLVP